MRMENAKADAGRDVIITRLARPHSFPGANGDDRKMFIFRVQLMTKSRIGNLTRLIHTLLYVMTIQTHTRTTSSGMPSC